jgi:glycine cleavage system aminomethyltransferase T
VTEASPGAEPVPSARIVLDGRPIEYAAGDTLATAIVRAGEWPTAGGTLCLAGDCGNCLATVDGVAYVRTCQVPASFGTVVTRQRRGGKPFLPIVDASDVTRTPPAPVIPVKRASVDVVVAGTGRSGAEAGNVERDAGRTVVFLDAKAGEEVVAIYPGPAVIVRERGRMVHLEAEEIIVATGSAEIQPVCPGSGLSGIVTAGAAEQLRSIGVDLGRVVTVTTNPVRFEGADGRVTGVVTVDAAGLETRTPCDTAVVDLGRAPRDILARMLPGGPVTAMGSAAVEHPLPPAPTDGVVCPCMGTTVEDLDAAWAKGYTELELLKRATWAGLGPCQGGACLPHVRAFIAARTSGPAPAPFTARPAARQITLAEAAADTTIDAFRRTPLHDEHLAAGARMDRFGGWFRPWHYGDVVGEYWAVREGVSIGDVSTLGKLTVSGPDVVEALERIYPCHVADIKVGRSRYALLLNERGHVMDDGMILRDAETRFTLTFTSGGAANAEMWIRDWVETWGLRVHVMDRTMSLAAINVTGPLATKLLQRLGLADPPRFLVHVHAEVAGVPCHVMRLSFTGETAFELHHPVDRSVELWRALLRAGRSVGIRPHGLQALFGLRLEKGHVIVGMDTELDTTPRRLGMDWAVRMEKPAFIGRASLERTARINDERRWVGFAMDGEAPAEGTPIRSISDSEIVGNVTGSWTSPLLGKALMLGWQRYGRFDDRVEIDGREAIVTPTPFYDPEGRRARA